MLRPALALLLAAAAAPALAAPRLVAAFDDPAHDATGPGTYAPPGDAQTFTPGDFDLRRLAVYEDGEDVLLEVTLGAPIRLPAITQRANQSELQLWNGVYLQNVDVYVDSSPAEGSGFRSCIPGRRVTFADGRTWEAAVVITPQPGAVRNVVTDAMGRAAGSVHVVQGLVVRGRTITARVPAAALGGKPSPAWGFSVHVSGARWERSYGAMDRVRGKREPDAFTMPVLGTPEAWAFGGAPAGDAHPRVVDVLLPQGVDQKAVLGSFHAESGRLAAVPFVYAEAPPSTATPTGTPTATPTPTPTPTPTATVVDVSGDLVTLSGLPDGVKPLQLGRVLGADGSTIARVAVERLLEGGAVARAVEGAERVPRGARVAFDRAP